MNLGGTILSITGVLGRHLLKDAKTVKEVSKLACGYLKKSSRYREQSLQRPEVGMCLV